MNRKKILVLGSKGMLGHMVFNYLNSLGKYKVIPFERGDLNAEWSEEKIEKKIKDCSPNAVINCVGLINKYANKKGMKKKAKVINSKFPHTLLKISAKNHFRLIHISTDCYLDKNVYGRSKRKGEINDKQSLTIRTSIIGPELKEGFGLFHWFMKQKGEVEGYTKVFWDGVTTLQLSKFIEECIENPKLNKIVDYRTRHSTNKYELLVKISEVFNKKIPINKNYDKISDKRNLKADFFCEKDYIQQLVELKRYTIRNRNLYHNYLIENPKLDSENKLKKFYLTIFPNYVKELERELFDCDSLLDLGCGDNSPVKYLKNKPYCVGIDKFRLSIQESKKQNIHNKYFERDLKDIGKKFGEGSFDCVLASDVIEHFTKKEGNEFLKKMEVIAKKKVIVFTPNGFLPQEKIKGNPWQEHKSGWYVDEMQAKGYFIKGISGWKKLRGDFAKLKYRPEFLWRLISDITQLYTRNHPKKAFSILCVKKLS